jgi:hypothetical protein
MVIPPILIVYLKKNSAKELPFFSLDPQFYVKRVVKNPFLTKKWLLIARLLTHSLAYFWPVK